MNRAVIYHDGSYDEGTGDELESRRNGRDPHMEHPIGPGITLPAVFAEARRIARETPEGKAARLVGVLADDLGREALGKLAERVRGTGAEVETLTAIRAQIDERLAEIEGGAK